MNYIEAQAEFNLRLYRWAKINLEEEMRESFPSFQFCGKVPSRTCQFLSSLDQHSRAALGSALLLATHKDAAKVLNEVISDEATALMRQLENLRWKGSFAAEPTNDNPALATRRQLKRAMKERFLAAYGNQCLPPDPLDGNEDMVFRMQCRGWIIKTSFDFGSWASEITYDHSVWTGKWVTKETPAILFANCIGFRLNYGNEIGIGSRWEKISVEQMEAVCTEIIGHCQRMFDVFPKLLEGLDLELLTK